MTELTRHHITWWRRLSLALYALLAGAVTLTPSCPAYGVSTPPPPETGLELISLEYAPASPIHIGDRLLFKATTTRASQLAGVEALFWVANGKWERIDLHDDGVAPDVIGGDGVWSAETLWYKAWGTAEAVTIQSLLTWDNGAFHEGPNAPALTVLPLEKDGA